MPKTSAVATGPTMKRRQPSSQNKRQQQQQSPLLPTFVIAPNSTTASTQPEEDVWVRTRGEVSERVRGGRDGGLSGGQRHEQGSSGKVPSHCCRRVFGTNATSSFFRQSRAGGVNEILSSSSGSVVSGRRGANIVSLAQRGRAAFFVSVLTLLYFSTWKANELHFTLPSLNDFPRSLFHDEHIRTRGDGGTSGRKSESTTASATRTVEEQMEMMRSQPSRTYTNVSHFPHDITSSGPYDLPIPGMLAFHNVCVTLNMDQITDGGGVKEQRGLLYFDPTRQSWKRHDFRCVPCSNPVFGPKWTDVGNDEEESGHKCGLPRLHAMFAANISDFNDCLTTPDTSGSMTQEYLELWAQRQRPSFSDLAGVQTVYWYDEPTWLVQYMNGNPGHSFWDMVLSFVPYWHHYLRKGGISATYDGGGKTREGGNKNNNSSYVTDEDPHHYPPFTHALLQQDEYCATTSREWVCRLLRTMGGFRSAGTGISERPVRIIPPEPNNHTLYCFDTLYVSEITRNRLVEYPEDFGVDGTLFHDLQYHLEDELGLTTGNLKEESGRRDAVEHHHEKSKEATAVVGNIPFIAFPHPLPPAKKRVALYAHEPSGRRVWNGMASTLDLIREDYSDKLDFIIIHDFGNLTLKEQAQVFHQADAVVMVHGAQMANSVFARKGLIYVELGCEVPTFVGERPYIDLIGGRYTLVTACPAEGSDTRLDDEADKTQPTRRHRLLMHDGAGRPRPCVQCPPGLEGEAILMANFTVNRDALAAILDDIVFQRK